MNEVYLSFRENLLIPHTTSMYGVVSYMDVPTPYKEDEGSCLLLYKTDKPYEFADGFSSDKDNVVGSGRFVILGYPSDCTCLLLVMDLSNGYVYGYDRRVHHLVQGASFGMGSYVRGISVKTTVEDLSFAVSAWHDMVSSVPRETGGKTLPWTGEGYSQRDFHFYVDAGNEKNTDRLITLCKELKLLYVDFRKSGGFFELVHPARDQVEKIIKAGWAVRKDWYDAK